MERRADDVYLLSIERRADRNELNRMVENDLKSSYLNELRKCIKIERFSGMGANHHCQWYIDKSTDVSAGVFFEYSVFCMMTACRTSNPNPTVCT